MESFERPRIVLTGGGTTGHVAVNLALIPQLLERGWKIHYIGSKSGIERSLIADFPEVTYHAISTGKLRRYLSRENIADAFRVLGGTFQAQHLLAKIRPRVIFSKGGYVSVPVVYGGALHRIPSITHESDLTPGLANRLCYRWVKEVLLTFRKSEEYVPREKSFYLGPVIREQIKGGSRERGLQSFGFSGKKPILVVLGGSLGAAGLNECIWQNFEMLTEHFDILHGCGEGKKKEEYQKEGYVAVEYFKDNMKDVLAMADIIVSRAGSNAIFEFLYYRKPMLLVPLPTAQSRGDQLLNAAEFEKQGFAKVLQEEDATPEHFRQAVLSLYHQREAMIEKQKQFAFPDAVSTIIQELERFAKK